LFVKPPAGRQEGTMRWLARAALAVLGSMTSVFIACAYGVPWRYEKSGHVRDAASKQGIPGILVSCEVAGTGRMDARTDVDGAFFLGVDGCDALAFADVDGAANGTYAPASVPFTAVDERDMVVELDPAQ
jgi:hypothetical protein